MAAFQIHEHVATEHDVEDPIERPYNIGQVHPAELHQSSYRRDEATALAVRGLADEARPLRGFQRRQRGLAVPGIPGDGQRRLVDVGGQDRHGRIVAPEHVDEGHGERVRLFTRRRRRRPQTRRAASMYGPQGMLGG